MLAAIGAVVLLCATPAHAAPGLPAGFAANTLTTGLTNPVAVAWTPDGRMLSGWSVRLGGPLPRGRYVLLVRAFDRSGHVTYGAGGHTRLALRV